MDKNKRTVNHPETGQDYSRQQECELFSLLHFPSLMLWGLLRC